jgi:hypothetical protein
MNEFILLAINGGRFFNSVANKRQLQLQAGSQIPLIKPLNSKGPKIEF